MAFTKIPTSFGASVVPKSQADDEILRAPPTLDSPALTPAVSRDDMSADFLERPIPPHSPFYQHPPVSFERIHSRNTSKNNIDIYEKDLESGHATPLTANDDNNPFTSKVSVDCNKECRMWPSKQTLMQEKLAAKKQKRSTRTCGGCTAATDLWSRFDKRQKLLIEIVLALLLVGAIVGIAVGISKAVHGGVYAGNSDSHEIGDSSR